MLDRLAALVPSPGVHRHRYFGVLAPNSPLRDAVTALAPGATTAPPAPIAEPATDPAHRRAARNTWALLLARSGEVFPLVCLCCVTEMRFIAFVTEPPSIGDILLQLGEPTAHRTGLRPASLGPSRYRDW